MLQPDLLGNNDQNTSVCDNPVVSQINKTTERDKYKKALDDLCRTWSEVKLLQMKSSDVEYYMNKLNNLKGDNKTLELTISPVRLSHMGRPLRKLTGQSYAGIADTETDSDYESDFIKSPNRKQNFSKPHAAGPSASRVAAQNIRTSIPETVLPSTSNGYKRSDSPDYSDQQTEDDEQTTRSRSSSGSNQTFKPDISEGESTDTFDGFDENDVNPTPKRGTGKGSLNMVQYGIHKRK